MTRITLVLAVSLLLVLPVSVPAQESPATPPDRPASALLEPPLAYAYEYRDANFQLRLLPDSACCVEVEYKGLKGYLGVQPNGTPSMPYRYTLDPAAVTSEGVTVGSAIGTAHGALRGPGTNQLIADNLHALLDRLLQRHAEIEARKDFNRKRAYEALRAQVQALAKELPPEG